MEDKELIELAAKAAGLHVKVASNSGRGLKVHGNCNWWNPLTDDGDALRLAVRLDMHIALFGGAMESRVLADGDDWSVEGWECGKEEATRRAITRAAAQIGKEME